jgi:Fe-S-cluster-containing dehydrogenase component
MDNAKLSRRKFLLGSGAALAGTVAMAATVKPARALAKAEEFAGYPDRYGMLTDTTLCVGCRMCEMACNQANDLPEPGVPFTERSVFEATRRTDPTAWTVVNRYDVEEGKPPVYRKVQCMHCNEPSCTSACLVGAIKKTKEGPVIYDPKLCIGCRYCMNACPYNGLSYSYDDPIRPAVFKCLMCHERITADGKMPACAEACPTKATIFGKRSDLLDIARKRIVDNPGKYVNHIYGEKEAGGSSWLYLSSVDFTKLGLPGDLGSTPFPEFTRDWLLAVPLVIIMWPTLLMGMRRAFNNKNGDKEPTLRNGSK